MKYYNFLSKRWQWIRSLPFVVIFLTVLSWGSNEEWRTVHLSTSVEEQGKKCTGELDVIYFLIKVMFWEWPRSPALRHCMVEFLSMCGTATVSETEQFFWSRRTLQNWCPGVLEWRPCWRNKLNCRWGSGLSQLYCLAKVVSHYWHDVWLHEHLRAFGFILQWTVVAV